jgi:hypothetical protein
MNTNLDKLMAFDAVQTAEDINENIKKDGGDLGLDGEQNLALLLHMNNSKKLEQIFTSMNDTVFSDKFERVVGLIENSPLGFRCVYQGQFDGNKPQNEEERIYWSKTKGIVIHLESWGTAKVNGIHAYFQVVGTPPQTTVREQNAWISDKLYPLLSHMSHGSTGDRDDWDKVLDKVQYHANPVGGECSTVSTLSKPPRMCSLPRSGRRTIAFGS